MLGSCGWLRFLWVLQEKIRNKQGLLICITRKPKYWLVCHCSISSVYQAFSLHLTELSNVAALISLCSTGGFTGQILCYSNLYDVNREKKRQF